MTERDWEKVKPLESLRDKALSGTKAGRADYVAVCTLAETYAWHLAMNELVAACEVALARMDKWFQALGEYVADSPMVAEREQLRKALAKARGETK